MAKTVHLAKRFFGSYSPIPLAERDRVWVEGQLNAGELALWQRMSRADRKHAAQVARACDELLRGAPQEVVAAAVLHDVGKISARFGPVLRAVTTVLAALGGRTRIGRWAGDVAEMDNWRPPPMTRPEALRIRMGRYVRHDEISGHLLTEAGSHPLTVAWAREHHLPPERWTLPRTVADALAAADDD